MSTHTPATERLYDNLCTWAENRNIRLSIHDQPATLGRVKKVTLNGIVSVEFSEAQLPIVVVEWGDGYRGDFPHGLPTAALTGLIGGFIYGPDPEAERLSRTERPDR